MLLLPGGGDSDGGDGVAVAAAVAVAVAGAGAVNYVDGFGSSVAGAELTAAGGHTLRLRS